MDKEDKDILLQDLCARLPYGVQVKHPEDPYPVYLTAVSKVGYESRCRVMPTLRDTFMLDPAPVIEHIRPYLRPMSSMTEKEKHVYQSKQTAIFDFKNNKLYTDNYNSLDYLNSIHVDYRNLIGKGLALEAPEGMYK